MDARTSTLLRLMTLPESDPMPPQQQPYMDPMNGRAMPVQSVPTWEQVQRFMAEIFGPRPAH